MSKLGTAVHIIPVLGGRAEVGTLGDGTSITPVLEDAEVGTLGDGSVKDPV